MAPWSRLRSGLLVVACLAVCLAACSGGASTFEAAEQGFDPATWTTPEWERILGSDPAGPEDTAVDLAALAAATDLAATDLAPLVDLAIDVASAEATGRSRSLFGDYFPENHPAIATTPAPPSGASTRACAGVEVLAVSPFTLPVAPSGAFVKALVAWTGTCPFPPPTAGTDPADARPVYLTALYVARADAVAAEPLDAVRYADWRPIRPLAVPGADRATALGYVAPPTWERATLDGCASPGVVVHVAVAAAYAELCATARADGVRLVAFEGLRDRSEQADMFAAAVEYYGDEDQARLHVAFADATRCESTHCAGEALDVEPTAEALAWLTATVGCLVPDGSLVAPPCVDDSRPVRRLERFGFTNPVLSSPNHLEFALGTLSADVDLYGDCTPGPVAMAERIIAVFRCRVLEAGFSAATADVLAADAVQVASCTSGLDPSFRSHGGRFERRPNPDTGQLDDRRGLFGLSAAVADAWLVGGADARTSSSVHIDAAARLVVEERRWGRWGWDLFACATGDDGVTVPVPPGR